MCLDEVVGRMDGPAALRALSAFDRQDWRALCELDDEITALRPSSAMRRSSRIFTREDMAFLVHSQALPDHRIIGVQTGGCPHTAIRGDASMNFDALDELSKRHADLDIVFLESGGDNLAASFSPELVDASIYIIDVSGADKIPRKGGAGVTRSDLLVINKIDLAPHVGARLDVMARDAKMMRGDRPFVFTNLKGGAGLEEVVAWIRRELLYEHPVLA